MEENANDPATKKIQTDGSQDTPEEAPLTGRKMMMISLALMDGAMRYREGYWRENIEEFKKELELKADFEALTKEKGWRSRRQKVINSIVLNYRQEEEKLNKTVYGHIEKFTEHMGAKFKTGFDNYATGASKMIEEYAKASSTVEILTVCQMYNNGYMEDVFEKIKEINKTKEIVEPEFGPYPQPKEENNEETTV